MRIQQGVLHNDVSTPVEQAPSPNHGGPVHHEFLLVHYTAGRDLDSSVRWLRDPRSKASAHLVIGRDGRIVQLVNFMEIAWHAGNSTWTNPISSGVKYDGLNKFAIGIELDNPGALDKIHGKWTSLSTRETFPDSDVMVARHKNGLKEQGWLLYTDPQLESFMLASLAICRTYGISEVLGHEDVAPGRKMDPGPAFPMEHMRARLFGREDP